jgi:hypothetical protein
MHFNLRRTLGRVTAQGFRRVNEEGRPYATQTKRGKGTPVDRDGDQRPQEPERLGGAARVKVAGADRRSPSPDGHERDIKAAADLSHVIEDVRVAGEVDPAASLDYIAQGDSSLTEGQPGTVMLGVGCTDRQGTNLDFLPGLHLDHPPEPAAPEQTATPARHDQRYFATQSLEGGQVEVIKVEVRNQNGIDVGVLRRVEGNLAAKVCHAVAQHGIGQ